VTTAELIHEVQIERLIDPLRAAILELELDHRVAAIDGSELQKMRTQRDLLELDGVA